MMEKCNYCSISRPDGTCPWKSYVAAEDDCKKAIKNMIQAKQTNHKKRSKFKF